MQDDLQRELERDIRRDARREWAYRHRALLTIAALMLVAMAIGAAITYVTEHNESEPTQQEPAEEGTAATIDGKPIPESDVTAYITQYRNYAGYQEDGAWATFLDGMSSDAKTMREDAIKALARRVAVEDKAAAEGVEASDEEIDARIKENAKDAGREEDIEAYVTGTLMYASMDDYRADARMEVLLDKLIATDTKPIDPTDLQMVIHAADSPASYIGSRTYDVAFPVGEEDSASDSADAQTEAEGFAKGLASCESTQDFLAKAKDAGREATDLGWSCLTDPSAAQLKAMDGLQAGSASKPFRDGDGWHVLWCAETFTTRPDSALSLSEMPEEIYDALKVDTMDDLLADDMAKYADDLLTEHNLKVNAMPSGLPYDVDMELSYYRQEESETDAEDAAQSGIDALELTAQGETAKADGSGEQDGK